MVVLSNMNNNEQTCMITLSHVGCRFGERNIFHDVNTSFAEGSMCAIMGANGCGKTTLLRTIANLLPPQEGVVMVDQRPVKDYSVKALAQKIAFVRQQSQTDLDFSAFEIVLMGRNPYQHRLQNESQKDWDIVERCMRLTNTYHLRFAKPHEMSGGELQRVMIARALAQNTPILLLDEPTSNLDIAHQFEIMQLLCDINKNQKKTILIVVHDLNLAYRFCSSLLLMHDHKVFFHGPMKEGLTGENVKTVFQVDAVVGDGLVRYL